MRGTRDTGGVAGVTVKVVLAGDGVGAGVVQVVVKVGSVGGVWRYVDDAHPYCRVKLMVGCGWWH